MESNVQPVGDYGATREQVDACKRWIELYFKPTLTVRKRLSSYYYKHVVEQWAGFYVCSDAFTEAARELNYKVERIEGRYHGITLNSFIAGVVNAEWKAEQKAKYRRNRWGVLIG